MAYASGPKLMVQGTGQAPLEAAPFHKDIFVTEPLGAEVVFERDAGGKVIALTLNTRGQAPGPRSTIAAGTMQALRLTYQLRTNCRSVTTDRTTVARGTSRNRPGRRLSGLLAG